MKSQRARRSTQPAVRVARQPCNPSGKQQSGVASVRFAREHSLVSVQQVRDYFPVLFRHEGDVVSSSGFQGPTLFKLPHNMSRDRLLLSFRPQTILRARMKAVRLRIEERRNRS